MKCDIAQLEFVHPLLREICIFAEDETGLEFTITSLYRIGDIGVHGQLPLRGIDLRMRNKVIGETVVKLINKSYSYDSNRPELSCAILHGEGSNMHIHLQVHPKTRRILHD